jgi:hypothetical protein
MHCKFQDIKSGRALEVDFSLDKKGEMTQSNIKERKKKLKTVKVE